MLCANDTIQSDDVDNKDKVVVGGLFFLVRQPSSRPSSS
jgi:hypothetical protein